MTVTDLLPSHGRSAVGDTSSHPLPRDLTEPRQGAGQGGGTLADLPSPISFTMPTPPSTNHLFKNVKGVGRVKSKAYDDFVRMGVADIRRQRVGTLQGPVIAVIGVERMSGSADIDNRLKAMLDTIVEAGVIEDDRFVTAIAITWLPKANGLSWVRLLPVQHVDLTFHPSQDGASGGWFSTAPSTEQEGDEPDGHFTR